MRWIQCPQCRKLIAADEYDAHAVKTDRRKPIYGVTFGDRDYENLRLQDGTIINSRKQHRDYMRRKGLTTIDDFSRPGGTWERQQKARDKFLDGHDPSRKRDVIDAYKQLTGKL